MTQLLSVDSQRGQKLDALLGEGSKGDLMQRRIVLGAVMAALAGSR